MAFNEANPERYGNQEFDISNIAMDIDLQLDEFEDNEYLSVIIDTEAKTYRFDANPDKELFIGEINIGLEDAIEIANEDVFTFCEVMEKELVQLINAELKSQDIDWDINE